MGLKIVIPIEYQRVKKISLMAMGAGGGELPWGIKLRAFQ
jgi:hypothetical protein